MNKRVKGELLTIKSNRLFFWVSVGSFAVMLYNMFFVAFDMKFPIEGGYCTYTLLTIAHLLGVSQPVIIGAFVGAMDETIHMTEYKLSNKSVLQLVSDKLIAIVLLDAICLVLLCAAGIGADLSAGLFVGSFMTNTQKVITFFIVTMAVWVMWSFIAAFIALLVKKAGLSLAVCLSVFFGEQYLDQFMIFSQGILWNQKSFVHSFFYTDGIPFGVVQNSYESGLHSLMYIVTVTVLGALFFCIYYRKKYHRWH